MATHSSTLAWKIPWMEEPGGLQSMGLRGVGHDWETSLSLFSFLHWRRKWQPTPVFLPGESQGWGSLVAAIYGVTQSRIRLKWLSSSSSRNIVGTLLEWRHKYTYIFSFKNLGISEKFQEQHKEISKPFAEFHQLLTVWHIGFISFHIYILLFFWTIWDYIADMPFTPKTFSVFSMNKEYTPFS